jgi:hypothetical protein
LRALWPLLAVACAAALVAAPAASASEPEIPQTQIEGVGGVAGVNYKTFTTDEPLNLDNQSGSRLSGFLIYIALGWYCDLTPPLPTGQVYTLVSTTGGLTGEFPETPNGTVVNGENGGHDCFESKFRFRIEYHESGPVQTVTATVVEGRPTPVSDVVVTRSPPGPLLPNQPVTQRVIVETSSGRPEGTVDDPCGEQRVTAIGRSFGVICHTLYAAEPSGACTFGVQSSVRFVPASEAAMAGWEQRTPSCAEFAPPKITLRASGTAPHPNEDVTFTARVTPKYLGPIVPSGTVTFREVAYPDPLPSCEDLPLTPEGGSGVATCHVSYATPGPHEIIVTYSGGELFEGSGTEGDLFRCMRLRSRSTLRCAAIP